MRSAIIVFSLLGLFGNAACAGDIFRCISTDGGVMFTNMPCPADSKAEHVASYTPVPDTPLPAYSKPSFAPAVSARSSAASYQVGYDEAQGDGQNESSDDSAYAGGWIPYYPARRANGRDHRHHPPKAVAHQAPSHSLRPSPNGFRR